MKSFAASLAGTSCEAAAISEAAGRKRRNSASICNMLIPAEVDRVECQQIRVGDSARNLDRFSASRRVRPIPQLAALPQITQAS